MLKSLHIQNFILIDEINLDFDAGLTALTGETGSGKSILLDAISLIMGERAQADLVKYGCDVAYISADFHMNTLAIEWLKQNRFYIDEQTLNINRSIDKDGKNKGKINNIPATSTHLKALTSLLIEIQGQYIQQELLGNNKQRELLDKYCDISEQLNILQYSYNNWKDALNNLEQAKLKHNELKQKFDELQLVLEDLNDLKPHENEWLDIQAEHKKLQYASDIIERVTAMQSCFNGEDSNINSMLKFMQQKAAEIRKYDEHSQDMQGYLQDAQIQLNELDSYLHKYLQKIDIDPERLEYLDLRMSSWLKISRRINIDPQQLHTKWLDIKEQINNIDDDNISKLNTLVDEYYQIYHKQAQNISYIRNTKAVNLQNTITSILQDLLMPDAIFSIEISTINESEHGIDRVNYMLRSHQNASPKALNKVASGGELSRIALALIISTQKQNLANSLQSPNYSNMSDTNDDTAINNISLIFDEIDSGISGVTAQKIGDALAKIAKNQQVLCVTHLAQVACYASNHVVVYKQNSNLAVIKKLNHDERLQELARLIGGSVVSNETIAHAQNMLNSAKNISII
jgi:DNA repair protein RecN (Recombination protein N)